MEVYEISGFRDSIDNSGVNFLSPADSYEIMNNGYIYRQLLQSRQGFAQFGSRLAGETRVLGIFENIRPDNTSELLVIDKLYLYKYNNVTGVFDQIPFNSADPIVNFGITNNAAYVSGTTYLKKDGTSRFVFTGYGMSDIYFYDGTDVKRFTNAVDNPDYQAPALGALTKATVVIGFGERLNFFSPVIAGNTQEQAILYSSIRDSSGNGDKFNSVGSGLLSADTYERMRGAKVLGDIILMTFERSNWVLEKTRDAFNPYFIRKIPSIIGTNAPFSSVVWGYELKSAGNTGLITTDGRQTLRFDNKIPYFAAEDISQEEFDLTYGGFDRENGQFLFSYRDSASQLTEVTQDRVLVYNYEESTWSINTQRFTVFGQTDEGKNLAMDDIDETLNPAWLRMDTTEEIWSKLGIEAYKQKTLAGDNDGFIYEINRDFDDYFVDITNITQAASAVVTVDASAFKIGDKVIFENVEGMTEINSKIGIVSAATDTSVTVNINSERYTAYTGSGTLSKVIDFEAKLVPFNPYRKNGLKCYVNEMEFLIDNSSASFYVDIYVDGERSPIKTALIEPTSDSIKEREWITITVNQEADFLNFVLRSEIYNNQVRISAIRIYAQAGSDK